MGTNNAAGLAIHLFGSFRILVRGRRVEDARWSRPQATLLVKLLALEPEHQLHRQQLIDAIWPDLDPESGAANLHKIIHLARHALEPKLTSGASSHFIVTSRQQVQLRSPGALWVDVEEFERLATRALRSGIASDYEEALRVYGGDLLGEDRYADWCAQKRTHLRAVRERLLMELGRVYTTLHEHERAITPFETLVAVSPSNEDAHRALMTLYALVGRRAQALAQFQRCRDAVRTELDTEPDEATVHLHRRILAREIQALPTRRARATDRSIDAIAVLPFRNETGDASLEYLSTGIADSLIKSLSHVPGLRVLAYSTVSRYRQPELTPRKLGRALDVQALITGRIDRVDDTLVIATELVHTSDGSRLWGEQYRLQKTGILAIQEEISREIAVKLRARMAVHERLDVKQYTADPEAFRLYLKGRFHWNKRTSDGLTKAIGYFEQAIQRDPIYALAYSGLADCYNLVSLYGVLPPKDTMPRAKAAARKALELDSSLAEAHTSLAYTFLYFDWEWAAAEHAFRRALAINPNYATAHHWYHEYLTAMGRFDEQMSEILLAQELDPLSLIINTDVGWGLYYGRAYDQAVEQLLRTLELDSHFAVAHLILGLAYAQQKAFGPALSSVQRAVDLSGSTPSMLTVAALGYVYALSGRSSDACTVMERLGKLPGARHASDYCQAMVLAGLDDRSAACQRLERAVEERHDRLIYLNVEPIFDGLRTESRFRALTSSIGLREHAGTI
jgi:DNA-binding SARP family transcriptional activator